MYIFLLLLFMNSHIWLIYVHSFLVGSRYVSFLFDDYESGSWLKNRFTHCQTNCSTWKTKCIFAESHLIAELTPFPFSLETELQQNILLTYSIQTSSRPLHCYLMMCYQWVCYYVLAWRASKHLL